MVLALDRTARRETRPHTSQGRLGWGIRRTKGHLIFNLGEWARFRGRHEGTHGRTDCLETPAFPSSFNFINTCKTQELFNT